MASSHTNPPHLEHPPQLSSLEGDLIEFFVHLALSLNLPRSIGALFGYLYCSDRPRSFEAIVAQLQVSRGSASQGLRFLESHHAVHRVFLPGDRRTYYRAETSLRTLFVGLLENKVRPQIQSSEERLEFLAASIEENSKSTSAVLSDPDTLHKRLGGLLTWHRKARNLLPWLTRLASRKA